MGIEKRLGDRRAKDKLNVGGVATWGRQMKTANWDILMEIEFFENIEPNGFNFGMWHKWGQARGTCTMGLGTK